MNRFRKSLRLASIVLGSLLVILVGFIVFWDTASPLTTCASCHEIESSSDVWAHSGHRSFTCKECHGSAFSNGFHSLTEKAGMVVHHFSGTGNTTVKLDEAQVVDMLGNCKRCHGMFFEGTIHDLLTPVSTKGPWVIKRPEESVRPVIPCLTCHQLHRHGSPAVSPDYSDPRMIFYTASPDTFNVLFYDRYENMHIDVANQPPVEIFDGIRVVDASTDPRQQLCIRCHAPNAFHAAGSSDDRSPRGVHEGISCLECHDAHSNNPRNSCVNCHPAMSDCGRDVTTMNTTFADGKSPHNIHFVRCVDCHTKGIPQKPS